MSMEKFRCKSFFVASMRIAKSANVSHSILITKVHIHTLFMMNNTTLKMNNITFGQII